MSASEGPFEGTSSERRDQYRLERFEQDGTTASIAIFYSAREALEIIPSLNAKYRLMLGDRLVWPNEAKGVMDAGQSRPR